MLKLLTATLLAAVVCAQVTVAEVVEPTPIKVFVMAGQSNMTGSANSADLPDELKTAQSDVLYSWKLGTNGTYTSNGWENLRPLNAYGTSFGSEVTFGRAAADALTEDVAVIKVAYNGRGLERWWVPWRNELYPTLVSHVTGALSDLVDAGYAPDLSALIWVQGQADSGWDYAADRYAQNLTSFVGSFREDMGVDDLTFIQTQQHWLSDASYKSIVRQQKINYTASDPNAHLVWIDDQSLKSDNVHFGSLAQIELGKRLWESYANGIDVLPEPGTVVILVMGVLGLGGRRH